MPATDGKKKWAYFISILSNDYEQFIGNLMSAAATVGVKTTCLDEELDQNYTTCLSFGGQCMYVRWSQLQTLFLPKRHRVTWKFFDMVPILS